MEIKLLKEKIRAGGVYFQVYVDSRYIAKVWCPRGDMVSEMNQFKVIVHANPLSFAELKLLAEACENLSYSTEPMKEIIQEAINALYPFADKTIWEDETGIMSNTAEEMWIERQWIKDAREAIKKLHTLL